MTDLDPSACPERSTRAPFLADVVRGLSSRPRSIPCKYFYDRRGSALFDRITEQPEYYLTGAETELLRAHAASIARALGPRVDLVELGSGSSVKTRLLLDALRDAARYVPVDISAEHLAATAQRLRRDYPDLVIEPLVGDYTRRIAGPAGLPRARRVVFFPGSSIGNFEPEDAGRFLARCRALAGPGGVVLVGVDLPKDRAVLEHAYDDRAGVTAAFNLNLLHRMKRELGAELDVDDFHHAARWELERSRVEMRLVASRATELRVGGRSFALAKDEPIVTEHCYKHDVAAFRGLASDAGLTPGPTWLDPKGLVSMHWLDAPSPIDRTVTGSFAP